MNVFGVGPMEMLVILIVALIFVGPERLPRFAADIARLIRDVRKYTGGLASEFNQVIKELEDETAPERAEWKEIGEGLSDATSSISSELNAAQTDAATALDAAPEPPASAPKTAANGASPNGASAPAQPVEKAT